MKRYQKSRHSEKESVSLADALLKALRGHKVPLEPLKLFQEFDVDEFLELLNHREPKRPTIPLSTTGMAGLKYTPLPTTGEILRTWVDEWLDSGRADDGDDPLRRNFTVAVNAAQAAYQYSDWRKIHLIGYGGTLRPVLNRYEKEPSAELRPLVGPRREDYAREQLVFFLLSPVRFSLAQCRKKECGAYFLLNQWNRLYPHGTLCEDCKRKRSQESAKDATAREREAVRVALHGAAAKRFRKEVTSNPLWYRAEAQKKKVADFLNAKFDGDESFRVAYPNGITGKWVANVKNWKPIEVAAKGGK
ncbi:MAG TPA: hypothetical protein VFC39_22315 [Acidobacteriaceae bacterium]|nr:hypothetical protein [Acidobacteriaceae bacterium]